MPQKNKKLLRALWQNYSQLIVALSDDWQHADVPPIFFGKKAKDFKAVVSVPPRKFGERAAYYIENDKLIFLLSDTDYPNVDFQKDPPFVAGTFNKWKGCGIKKWQLKQEAQGPYWSLKVKPEDCLKGTEAVRFKFITAAGHWLEPPSEAPNLSINEDNVRNFEVYRNRTGRHLFECTLKEPIKHLGPEEVLYKDDSSKERLKIDYGPLLWKSQTSKPLGARVEGSKTYFSLFAPRATAVEVRIYKKLGEAGHCYNLLCNEIGLWEIELEEDLSGSYYHYHVDGAKEDNFSCFNKDFKILDPYAKATVGREGPAIIVPQSRFERNKKSFHPPHWQDLVVLEAHVRDLIAKAPIEMSDEDRLGFKGLAKWVRSERCYLKELGVNAIELQPIQEFDNVKSQDYHWGYMSVNYFSPDSTYASDPKNASQIEEFRDVVDAFHESNMAVILDVVYNHVGEPNSLIHVDKYYYFEADPDGHLMNWSGCGNDFRANTPMGTRLIIDSLLHLIEAYDVDGFRFDLAELLGVDVLKEIEVALKKVKPSIILIAEPWSFRGHIGLALKDTGWSSWNDGYREFVRKYVMGEGNQDGLAYFLGGSTGFLSAWPAQSVNYTESHDDYCWLDRITENPKNNGSHPTWNDRRRTHLMGAILMMSLGIPMLAQGQDMLRSKQGVHNTYQRGDLNALDYDRALEYSSTHSYFRRLIEFRLSAKGHLLRLFEAPSPGYLKKFGADGLSSMLMLYNADHSRGPDQLLFAINPHFEEVKIHVGDLNPDGFVQIADHERFESSGLKSSWIRWEHSYICLPPVGCAIWLKP